MYDKHHIVAYVGDEVLETQVAQCYNIVYIIFTEQETVVSAIYRCLVAYFYREAIVLTSYSIFELVVLSTRSRFQNRSIVNWMSTSITSLKSSLVFMTTL